MRQVVIHMQYSVPASSQACGGPLAGVERHRLLCAFPASPITDAMRDFRVGLLNLFGLTKAARRLFGTFRQFCQEPRSVLSVLFSPSPLCVVAHDVSNGTEKGLDVGYA